MSIPEDQDLYAACNIWRRAAGLIYNELMSSNVNSFSHRRLILRNVFNIVFQACCVYKNEQTSDLVEASVGWTFLPLFQSNGAPVPNKTQVITYPSEAF